MKTLLALLASVALVIACSSSTGAADEACDPGSEIYCRCDNLDEGSQVCKDDGTGYERCEPCFDDYDDGDGYGYPEDDDDADTPATRDAGPDAAPTHDAATCGNGAVDDGESCDDGNAIEGDGCDACVAGGNPLSGSVCPGVIVHLWGAAYTLTGSSADASTAHTGIECDGVTGENSPDRVYSLVAHGAGTIHVELVSSSFDVALYARNRCDQVTDQTQVACSLAGSLDIPNVEADKPVYLTVDGDGTNQKGDYTLRLSFVPATPD